MEPTFIEIGGTKHAVVLPDYTAREELLAAYFALKDTGGVGLLRVYAAMIGLCTRIGRRSGVDYQAERFDVLAYGGKVYAWLRKGCPELTKSEAFPDGGLMRTCPQVAIPDIVAVGAILKPLIEADTFPSEDEVKDATGKSQGIAES